MLKKIGSFILTAGLFCGFEIAAQTQTTNQTQTQTSAPTQTVTPTAPTVSASPKPTPDSPKKADTQPKPSPAPIVAPPSMPPDQKAYFDATRIKDAQKKIAALEKFITDFPDSFSAPSAYVDILEVIVKNQPQDTEKILAQARKTLEKIEDSYSKAYATNRVAATLLKAGLLEEAEAIATKAVAASEEETNRMIQTFTRQKVTPLATLGKILLKRGKLKEADKILKQAYALNPTDSGVAASLAEIAEKQNKDTEALNYLLSAGQLKPEDRQRLETLYRKKHKGSLDGLEEELDARYAKNYSHLVQIKPYQATRARTERTVLAEVFTGAGCPPCVGADLAFDAMLERYSRQELVVLVYHQHIPRPDPLTNPSANARAKYYNFRSTPSYTIDGKSLQGGGGDKEMTQRLYNRFYKVVDERLEVSPEAIIKLNATLEGGILKVTANVENAKATSPVIEAENKAGNGDGVEKKEAPGLKLQIALVEEKVRYAGENGIRIHTMVVRDLAGQDSSGFTFNPSQKSSTINASFDLTAISGGLKKYLEEYEAKENKDREEKFAFSEKKDAIDHNNLAVVAFVQDEQSKKILQTVMFRLSTNKTTAKR